MGRPVTCPTAVIEQEQIALAGQAARDQMCVVLPDDPAELSFRRVAVITRAELPHDLARPFVDDRDDIGFARVPDQVVRVKARVPGVVPAVGAEHGQGVDVEPIAHAASAGRLAIERAPAGRTQIGVSSQGLARRGVEAELFKMFVRPPLPHDPSAPIDFHYLVIEQGPLGDVRSDDVLVYEQQGMAAIDERLLTGHVVPDRVALALEVVVLT
jgi:hypothetical protein